VVRVTVAVVRVVSVLLAEPDAPRYGLDLMAATGLPSGTVYPILRRMREAGWVDAAWEPIDPAAKGRPARRYYRLTGDGVARARAAVAEVRAAASPVPSRGEPPATGPRAGPVW
jgi:DNA-binding PadR family transcriptional regulator